MYMYIYVLVISGAFQQQKNFPYDRRINKNNDPPFVNKIVVAFKMLGIVVLFIYISIMKRKFKQW